MYKGKHTRKGVSHKRVSALVVSLVLLMSLGIGATLAWLTDTTPGLTNNFSPAEVPPEVTESFDRTLKSNVKVTNTGDTRAYVRAAIVVTWQDSQGNIAPEVPVLGTDYEMTLSTTDGWSQQMPDGYYYYGGILEGGASSGVLIQEAYQKVERNDGYQLVIEILAQTVQADGVNEEDKTPVELAWGDAAAYIPVADGE